VLELSGVSASYGSVPAITDVNISVGEGEAVGLLGANGAGKSTTLRAERRR
jgi:branched-chain amino acid transport system ATP-binding protein